jgi:Sulfotransferase family
VRVMLDSHPNISCGPMTRFLPDVVDAVIGKRLPEHLDWFGFPESYWWERVAELFDRIHSDYAARRGKRRWADKTGRYALHIDILDKLFPDCQVVHVLRDGRDVVASHRQRFGYVAAVKATGKWPVYVRTARSAGGRLGAGRYHEVRYEELVTDTEATLRKLLEFLGEPWDDAVLDYNSKPHDLAPVYGSWTAARRDQGGERAAVYRSRVGAGQRELDPILRLACRLMATGTLRELNYL